MPSAILETARLMLREMSPDDLDFVAAMLADAAVMLFLVVWLSHQQASAGVAARAGIYFLLNGFRYFHVWERGRRVRGEVLFFPVNRVISRGRMYLAAVFVGAGNFYRRLYSRDLAFFEVLKKSMGHFLES